MVMSPKITNYEPVFECLKTEQKCVFEVVPTQRESLGERVERVSGKGPVAVSKNTC